MFFYPLLADVTSRYERVHPSQSSFVHAMFLVPSYADCIHVPHTLDVFLLDLHHLGVLESRQRRARI
jgi:hypothetical protein